jgi:predicted GIY-YIG superfamily endonuclease
MSKTYWVYILECSDGSYYTGSTSDIETRISQHQVGACPGYTRKRRPVKLVFSDYFEDVYEAISAERQIKGWTRAKKEALINGDFLLLKKLAKKKWK